MSVHGRSNAIGMRNGAFRNIASLSLRKLKKTRRLQRSLTCGAKILNKTPDLIRVQWMSAFGGWRTNYLISGCICSLISILYI